MARTKAMAVQQRQTARKSQHDPFEESSEYDSEEEYSDEDDQAQLPHSGGPSSAAAAPRADGWCITGDWSITTNDTQYGDSRGPFIWSFFETGSRSWAQFDVGFLKGIIKLDKSLSNITPPRHNKAKFVWRGRETGEDQMEIDDASQIGELVFKQQAGGFMVLEGCLKGSYCGSEGMRFIGSRVRDTPRNTRQNWSSYNARNYEQERVGRWGAY